MKKWKNDKIIIREKRKNENIRKKKNSKFKKKKKYIWNVI